MDRDEPLFEISTDKVDAEIPAPAAGVLLAILVREGETVPVESVVGVIGAEGEEVWATSRAPAAAAAPPPGGAAAPDVPILRPPVPASRHRGRQALRQPRGGGSRRRSCGASRAITT